MASKSTFGYSVTLSDAGVTLIDPGELSTRAFLAMSSAAELNALGMFLKVMIHLLDLMRALAPVIFW